MALRNGGWQRAKEVHGPDGQPVIEPGIAQVLQVGKEQIRRALQTLAYTVHRRQRAAATVGDDAADISEGEVLVAFKPLLGKADTEALLRYPRERAGLLLARRPGVYAFPHRSFQEFLAACYLADQPDAIESLVRLVNDDPAYGGVGDARAVGRTAKANLLMQGPDVRHGCSVTYLKSVQLINSFTNPNTSPANRSRPAASLITVSVHSSANPSSAAMPASC